jgi:nucleoid DNA-binding protein
MVDAGSLTKLHKKKPRKEIARTTLSNNREKHIYKLVVFGSFGSVLKHPETGNNFKTRKNMET